VTAAAVCHGGLSLGGCGCMGIVESAVLLAHRERFTQIEARTKNIISARR